MDRTESACVTPVTEQICNSCAAQSAAATVEWCLCQAEGSISARSVQQLLECTDGLAVDEGTQVERRNSYCVSGFPDVHMEYIIR